jgi:hypothetical protein
MSASLNLHPRDVKFASRLQQELAVLGLHYNVVCEADGIWRIDNIAHNSICTLKYYGIQSWNVFLFVPGTADKLGKATTKSFNSSKKMPSYKKIVTTVALEILVLLVKNKCVQ